MNHNNNNNRNYVSETHLDFEFYSKLSQTVCLNNITTNIENIYNRNPKKFIFYKDNIEYSDYDYTDTDLGPQNDTESDNDQSSWDSKSLSIQTVQETSSSIIVNNIRNLSYLKSHEYEYQPLKELPPVPIPVPTPAPPPPPPPAPAPAEETKQKEKWYKPIINILDLLKPINSNGNIYLFWLALVSLAYVYNIFKITSIITFDFDTDYDIEAGNFSNDSSSNNETIKDFVMNKSIYWFIFDYLSDLIYLIDIFLVQTRVKFLNDGIWVSDLQSTAFNYFKSNKFKIDLVTIIPFDLIQLYIGNSPLTRLNRVIKLQSLLEFFDRWDRAVQSFVFVVRLIRLFVYLQIVIHLYSCVYYKLSFWETKFKYVNNDWVYQVKHTKINKYINKSNLSMT